MDVSDGYRKHLERLGVDVVRQDLAMTGGMNVVGGTSEQRQYALKWARERELAALPYPRIRDLILRTMYEKPLSYWLDICEEIGINPQDAERHFDYLYNEGLLDAVSVDGSYALTHRAVKTIEGGGTTESVGASHGSVTIHNAGNMIYGPGGTNTISATTVVQVPEVQALVGRLADLDGGTLSTESSELLISLTDPVPNKWKIAERVERVAERDSGYANALQSFAEGVAKKSGEILATGAAAAGSAWWGTHSSTVVEGIRLALHL